MSEVYVDENGWAYDDEGNKYFVGKGYGGETYSRGNAPWYNRRRTRGQKYSGHVTKKDGTESQSTPTEKK
jgi:hypothetical protein